MTTSSSFRRPLFNAGMAGLIGCVACCAIPLLAAAGVGGGALTALSAHLAPGTELVIGATVFLLTLAAAGAHHALQRWRSRASRAGCASECQTGGVRCVATSARES